MGPIRGTAQPQTIWVEAGVAQVHRQQWFCPDADLHRLTYTFSLSFPQEAPDASATVTIEPRVYQGKTELALPVKGRFMVHDGHDYYAHHRRLNTEHPATKDPGLTQNFKRYILDLNSTDESFDLYRGKGAKNEDWYAWGQPLYASGEGKEVGAVDTGDMLEST